MQLKFIMSTKYKISLSHIFIDGFVIKNTHHERSGIVFISGNNVYIFIVSHWVKIFTSVKNSTMPTQLDVCLDAAIQ